MDWSRKAAPFSGWAAAKTAPAVKNTAASAQARRVLFPRFNNEPLLPLHASAGSICPIDARADPGTIELL